MNRRASPATDLSKSDPSERFLSRANLPEQTLRACH